VTFPPRRPRTGLRRSSSSETFQPRLVAGFQSRFVPPSPFVRDLDGLLFPEPGDLFQPLTPMGFVLPAPRSIGRKARPCSFEKSHVRARGMDHPAKGSRLYVAPGARLPSSAEALPGRRDSPGPPKRSRSAFSFPPAPKCRRVASASLLPPSAAPNTEVPGPAPAPLYVRLTRHPPPARTPYAASSTHRPKPSLGDETDPV
jgi:hypothetical protein